MTTKADVLAAIEAREQHKDNLEGRDLWAIGKMLIGYCGEFEFGKNQGVSLKLQSIAKDAKAHGWSEYNVRYLEIIRETASVFKGRIHPELTFTHHREAGSPDFLDWVVEQCGVDLSYREIKKMRKRWQLLEKKQRKQKLEEAKDAERHAVTPQARERAKERAKELVDMPEPSPTKLPRPDGEAIVGLRQMAGVLDIENDALTMVKTLRSNLTAIDRMLDEINVDYIDSLVEKHEAVAMVATQIVDRLGKSRLKRFGVIRGGKAS
jgi:hypothetical protein